MGQRLSWNENYASIVINGVTQIKVDFVRRRR